VIPGASDAILRTLETLGFWWDGEVLYQSRRLTLYDAALQQLSALGSVYACSCSRRDLGGTDDAGGYPGTCRAGPRRMGPTALRFRADLHPMGGFEDAVRGWIEPVTGAAGDPIVRRRDGLYAYQLAVVVDDAASGVTHVVRGADLLPSTAWQRCLQRALRLPAVAYGHIPLVTEQDGTKLSKSKQSIAPPQLSSTTRLLHGVLTLLQQQPPVELMGAPVTEVWQWGIGHWRIERLRGLTRLAVCPHLD